MALAGISISAASLERVDGRTRIVIESKAAIRYSLFIFRNPNRVVLELEDVEINPVLAGLAGQVAADHPYLKPLRIRPSASGAGAVQLEFGLKAEAEPHIRALEPEAGQGYRLVLDIIVPLAQAAPFPTSPPLPPCSPSPCSPCSGCAPLAAAGCCPGCAPGDSLGTPG